MSFAVQTYEYKFRLDVTGVTDLGATARRLQVEVDALLKAHWYRSSAMVAVNADRLTVHYELTDYTRDTEAVRQRLVELHDVAVTRAL